jgi:hypothetical protein
VTPDLVKDQLQSLANQIEQIRLAKQEMIRVINSQKAQKQMLNLSVSEEEAKDEATTSYLNELVLRPILDQSFKKGLLAQLSAE